MHKYIYITGEKSYISDLIFMIVVYNLRENDSDTLGNFYSSSF